jgi:hypothetical protein
VAAALADPAVADTSTFPPEPDPLLFRIFAEVNPDENGILTFANRHGDLRGEWSCLSRGGREIRSHSALEGEPLDIWQGQIAAMQRLTGLWNLILREDEEALARHIRWEREPTEGLCVRFDSHPGPVSGGAPSLGAARISEVIASAESGPELLREFRVGEVVQPAKAYLQGQLDSHLHHVAEDVQVGMWWDSRRRHPGLSYWCPTLLSALWLQFATAVSENVGHGRCPECGTWFVVAQRAFRSSRLFCSTACRSKAYRERQGRARQLYTSGKSFEAIAEELDSDVATVRRWIYPR